MVFLQTDFSSEFILVLKTCRAERVSRSDPSRLYNLLERLSPPSALCICMIAKLIMCLARTPQHVYDE